jgi:streptogramin lyase
MSLKVTALAEPVRAKQVLSGRAIVDPVDGREKFWLTNMNEKSGGELISVDFEKDAAEIYHWPAGHGSWCVLPLPNERLAISTYYDGVFLLFDMRKKEFTRVIDFPGESYIWTMAMGSDGRVYGGTYSGAKLGCFDADTGAFEDCGTPVAGTKNLYLRTVTTTPGGDIACTLGFEMNSTQVYRVKTKQFEYLLPDEPAFQGSPLVSVLDCLFVSDGERGLMAFEGTDLKPVKHLPFPKCPTAPAWTGVARFSTDERVYLTAGGQLWRWLPGTGALALVHDIDMRGGNVYDVTEDGRLLGVRGQDYFVAQPGSRKVDLRRIPAESSGRPFHFLAADLATAGKPHRIWGGPQFGQTVASYEIGNGTISNTGAVVDSGGEVYGGVALKGKLYTASYAGADFAVYDPAKPWNQWDNQNPRHLGSIKTHNQCRPTGRMHLAPDGNLYSGWQAVYGEYGGAIARLNPVTEEITVWRNPLGEEPISTLAADDKYVYVGTEHTANGLPRREGKGQFGVWSLKEEKIVFQHRMETMDGVHCIGATGKPRLALFPEGDTLHVFDADAMKFMESIAVAVPGSPGWCEDVLQSPDKTFVLYARGKHLVRIHSDLRVEILDPIEHEINHMAFGPDGLLYFSSGTTLYSLAGL